MTSTNDSIVISLAELHALPIPQLEELRPCLRHNVTQYTFLVSREIYERIVNPVEVAPDSTWDRILPLRRNAFTE